MTLQPHLHLCTQNASELHAAIGRSLPLPSQYRRFLRFFCKTIILLSKAIKIIVNGVYTKNKYIKKYFDEYQKIKIKFHSESLYNSFKSFASLVAME